MLKRIFILSFVLISLSACQPQALERPPSPSMKGVELYSWETETGWRFSLLPGTNRMKTYDEVVAVSLTQEELVNELETLSEGEMIFWINWVEEGEGRDKLTFPPEDVIAEIEAYADNLGMTVEVIQP